MDDQGADVPAKRERTRSRGTLVCGRCGVLLSVTRPWHRYCSDRCRAAANRARQADRVRQMEALISELARLAGPRFLTVVEVFDN